MKVGAKAALLAADSEVSKAWMMVYLQEQNLAETMAVLMAVLMVERLVVLLVFLMVDMLVQF